MVQQVEAASLSPMTSPLQRFLDAQERDYRTAFLEIQNGRKQSHWIWYIFPQIQGLGFSGTSRFYAIENLREAQEYLSHPVLGPRLTEISQELLKLETQNATQVFGQPDDLKVRSSMTLFAAADPENPIFQQVLEKFFKGEKDTKTLQILGGEKPF
jgi:uncharacterized protein (DUF1810 family)